MADKLMMSLDDIIKTQKPQRGGRAGRGRGGSKRPGFEKRNGPEKRAGPGKRAGFEKRTGLEGPKNKGVSKHAGNPKTKRFASKMKGVTHETRPKATRAAGPSKTTRNFSQALNQPSDRAFSRAGSSKRSLAAAGEIQNYEITIVNDRANTTSATYYPPSRPALERYRPPAPSGLSYGQPYTTDHIRKP